MTQTEFSFAAPAPGQLFRYGSQNYQVYERLVSGGVTSAEMRDMNILCHTHRISDCREKLKPYNLEVVCEPFQGKVNVFRIRGLRKEAA